MSTGIMLEACLLGILSDQAFIFFPRPNKASTASMITGNGKESITCTQAIDTVGVSMYKVKEGLLPNHRVCIAP